jgi:hypothetical protein
VEKEKIIRVDLPESLHLDFKLKCTTKQENMKDRVKTLIQADVSAWKKGEDLLIDNIIDGGNF